MADVSWDEKQTRSADEAATLFVLRILCLFSLGNPALAQENCGVEHYGTAASLISLFRSIDNP